MASTLDVEDVLEVSYFHRYGEQTAVMVMHYVVLSVEGGQVSDSHAADTLGTRYGPVIGPLMDDGANFVKTRVQQIRPTRRDYVESLSGAVAGTIIGDALPPQCTGLIRLRGPDANRHNRGRKYVPFPAEADSAALSRPSATYISNLEDMADILKAQVNVLNGAATAVIAPVIYNRTTHAVSLVVNAYPVTAWATQRRRSFVNRPDPQIS